MLFFVALQTNLFFIAYFLRKKHRLSKKAVCVKTFQGRILKPFCQLNIQKNMAQKFRNN